MGAQVYANGLEVSGKASTHNVLASMPDVCLSPPSPPAGPIPIPYPNFAMSSDTTDGSKTVLAGGKEISLKGQSKYKKSTGDEAATKTLGMGLISHNITGAVKHKAGSFDVKIEGCDVVRTSDLTTGNHLNPGDGCATVDAAGVAPPGITEDACKELDKKNTKEREKVIKRLEKKEKAGTITQQQQDALNKARGTGMTVSSATSQVPGCEGTFSACSSGCAQAQNPSGLVPGGTSEQKCGLNKKTRASAAKRHDKKKEKAGVLCDKSYVHPGGGKGAHAEPKIFNEMGRTSAMRGGSVLLNIDWRFQRDGQPRQSGMPCPDCYDMLCHAATECDIQIFICDKDGNPQPLSKENCADEENGYENLSMRVDGKPRPGR